MNYPYTNIIGTGGIGAGMLYQLEGEHTLGRNESRLGELVEAKDFCKQHIILHYVSKLIAELRIPIGVYPIGMVGEDSTGKELLNMMKAAGMDTSYVAVNPKERTLFSVCYQYPDSSGGNITNSNSASSCVDSEVIQAAFVGNNWAEGRTIAVAAPEVSIDARLELLKQGCACDSYSIGSVLSGEIAEWEKRGGFGLMDLIAINGDEANQLAGTENKPVSQIADRCMQRLRLYQPKITALITDGAQGSYLCDSEGVQFIDPLPTEVQSTAGAGDAFLSGVIAGVALDIPLRKAAEDEFSAVELGTAVASMSVTSIDTINLDFNFNTFKEYLELKRPEWALAFRNQLDKINSVCPTN